METRNRQNNRKQTDIAERDDSGRFLPNNAGGPGRVQGSENRFTQLKRDLLAAYETKGPEELGGVAFWRYIKTTRPALFSRLLVSLLPRELLARWNARNQSKLLSDMRL